MHDKLKLLGFSNNEAIVFETLTKYQEISGSELSKKTGLDRSVTYNILDNLITKGHVSYIEKEGKRFFCIRNPQSLLVSLEEKKDIAKEIISDIVTKQKTFPTKMSVNVYEGKEALKLSYSEILASKNAYLLNGTGKFYDIHPSFSKHVRSKAPLSIRGKIIACKENALAPDIKDKRIKIKYMPKKYSSRTSLMIYDDVVLINSLHKEKPTVIRIQDEMITDALKKDFELMWALLP